VARATLPITRSSLPITLLSGLLYRGSSLLFVCSVAVSQLQLFSVLAFLSALPSPRVMGSQQSTPSAAARRDNSSSSSASNTPSREKWIEQFEQAVVAAPTTDPLHLDVSRREFLRDTASTLHRIVFRPIGSRADSANGFRRLLLGRKGLGKTSLLINMQRVAKERLREHGLICLYFNYEQESTSPLQLIHKNLLKRHDLRVPDEVENAEELCEWLEKQGRVLFLVLDEFQLVFTKRLSSKVAAQTICEAMAIGSSPLGRIHCVLSGSSAYMRRLCFSKIEEAEAHRLGFVHYHKGIDMNSTKFSARWIYPFSHAKDFRAAARLLSPIDSSQSSSEQDEKKEMLELPDLYLRTGGYPRFIDEAQRSQLGDTYSLGLRGNLSAAELSVLRYLREQLTLRLANQPLPDSESDADEQTPEAALSLFERLTAYTQLMHLNLSTLTGHLNEKHQQDLSASSGAKPSPPNWHSVLYDLADSGYLSYETSPNSLETPQLGFASARLFFDLLQRDQAHLLTLTDFCALLHPVPPFDQTAEHVVMQCLRTRAPGLFYPNGAASQSGFHKMSQLGVLSFSLDASSKSAQPSPKCASPGPSPLGAATVLPTSEYQSCTPDKLCSGVWKEGWSGGRDVLGADIVVFELKADTLIAHRVQVKLGSGSSKNFDWIKQAAERFCTMLSTAQQAYTRSAEDVKVELRQYLLTTRQHKHDMVQHYLNDPFTAVFNAKDLKQRLWSKEIQNLGKPFG